MLKSQMEALIGDFEVSQTQTELIIEKNELLKLRINELEKLETVKEDKMRET